uniref:Uncharacterized protein n=1 Tax=Anguilla anguilla TaxID=7936 RepID=A0A0E9PB63_ANGAN
MRTTDPPVIMANLPVRSTSGTVTQGQ